MSKSLFKSKTFWLNILGMSSLVLPGIPLDPETTAWVLAAMNIVTRVITKGPVHVIKDAATES